MKALSPRGAVVFGFLVAGCILGLACAQESQPVGPGEECFVATDCRAGLVCVPQRGGARLCSDDLSQVTGRPPPEAGGGDTGVPDGDADIDGPADGPVQEGGQDTGTDTGSADASADG